MPHLARLIAKRRYFVRFTIYWITFFIIAAIHWLVENFGPTTIPQLLYYLHFSSGLVKDTDGVYVVTFSLECFLGPTLAAMLLIAVELYVNTAKLTHAIIGSRFGPSSKVARFMAGVRRSFPIIALLVCVSILSWQFSVLAYLKARFGPDQFADNYVRPAAVKLHGRNLKNLVLIYVESLEASYGDQEIFGEDLIKEINAIPGSSFESYVSAPGTTWTMAGIVSTQCGMPLQFVPGAPENTYEAKSEPFLANATCLSDVLSGFGYYNVFLGGASLRFAGKGDFLVQHHYHEMYGMNEWRKSKSPAQGFNGWGMYDDDLFRKAKEKLLDLDRTGRLFNLTILTVDTHDPAGFYSKTCVERGAIDFEGILRCTSNQLEDFISFAAKHDLMKNTNFIVMGDHLARGNPIYRRLRRDPQRRIFNKFIASELPPKNRATIVPFDLFPTILEYLGFEIEGDRLGLGCSAFYQTANPCPRIPLTAESYDKLATSKAYQMLWFDDH